MYLFPCAELKRLFRRRTLGHPREFCRLRHRGGVSHARGVVHGAISLLFAHRFVRDGKGQKPLRGQYLTDAFEGFEALRDGHIDFGQSRSEGYLDLFRTYTGIFVLRILTRNFAKIGVTEQVFAARRIYLVLACVSARAIYLDHALAHRAQTPQQHIFRRRGQRKNFFVVERRIFVECFDACAEFLAVEFPCVQRQKQARQGNYSDPALASRQRIERVKRANMRVSKQRRPVFVKALFAFEQIFVHSFAHKPIGASYLAYGRIKGQTHARPVSRGHFEREFRGVAAHFLFICPDRHGKAMTAFEQGERGDKTQYQCGDDDIIDHDYLLAIIDLRRTIIPSKKIRHDLGEKKTATPSFPNDP